MKELTLNEWGNAIFTKQFTVLHVYYDRGVTVILDTKTDIMYSVTYNTITMKLELEEIDNE